MPIAQAYDKKAAAPRDLSPLGTQFQAFQPRMEPPAPDPGPLKGVSPTIPPLPGERPGPQDDGYANPFRCLITTTRS